MAGRDRVVLFADQNETIERIHSAYDSIPEYSDSESDLVEDTPTPVKQKLVFWLSYVLALFFLLLLGVLMYAFIQIGAVQGTPAFGEEMKRQMFYLQGDRHFMNHKSSSIPVVQEAAAWMTKAEIDPDHWFAGGGYKQPLAYSRRRLAKFIGTTKSNVVILDNTSTGVNAVFRSYNFTSEDTIMRLNFAHEVVKNVVKYISETRGPNVMEVVLKFPDIDDDYIVEMVEEALVRNPNVTFAVFSHITSVPTMILPVKRLVKLCRERGVPVFIDGAHAVGQIPLDMHDIDADYYVSSCHKWLFSAKGSAFLYVRPSVNQTVHPAVISTLDGFPAGFSFTGGRDYSSWVSLPAALDFREQIGGEEVIMQHNNELCSFAVTYLSSLFGTPAAMPPENYASMVNIELPCNLPSNKGENSENGKKRNVEHCYGYPLDELQKKMSDEDNFSVKFFEWDQRYYWRLTCQIYNDRSEIEKAGEIITNW